MASISGSIMGDEYTDSYYFCSKCQVYTLQEHHDRFLGDDDTRVRGPISRDEGDHLVKLIRQCPRPWDKKCRCPAHLEYFRGQLD